MQNKSLIEFQTKVENLLCAAYPDHEPETHRFRHYCESGNIFVGSAILLRHKTNCSYAGPIGWSWIPTSKITNDDYFELQFGWFIEVSLILERLTGRELDFRTITL